MTNQVGRINCCVIDFWLLRRNRLAAKANALGGRPFTAMELPVVQAAVAGF